MPGWAWPLVPWQLAQPAAQLRTCSGAVWAAAPKLVAISPAARQAIMVGFIIAPSKIQKTVALWARFMGGMRQWTNGSRSTFPVSKVETLYNALQR
jgi:hypothetical protein